MELVKNRIHMNQFKGNASTQITLDDDFIVPDTLDDMAQVMLRSGEIQIESVKNLEDKVAVKGKLEFNVLYRREGGGLQAMAGSIPFEESLNVQELDEKDYIGVSWILEDLSGEMINSRKLGIQAIVTLQVRIETLREVEAAVDVKTQEGDEGLQVLKQTVTAAAIALRHKDTYRMKEEITLSGGKPNIGRLLWQEMKLRDVETKPLDGKLHMGGDLTLFAIYQAEDENMPVQWLEETIPFSGELEVSESAEDMVPMVTVRLAHRSLEPRPDLDGEMRQLDVDAVLELDLKLYREEELKLLGDLYSTGCEVTPERTMAAFDQVLAKNTCKCRIAEKVELPQGARVLQICHSDGTIKIDEVEIGEDSVRIDGVLEVTLLYLTSDDEEPVQAVTEQLPFHCQAEARGIGPESVYQLNPCLEQLGAVMLGGDGVEVKGVLALDLLVLSQVSCPVITGVQTKPADMEQLKQLPGIVGYIVQPGDTLWEIAKKFHTTRDTVMAANELPQEEVKPGMGLLLVKEMAQI